MFEFWRLLLALVASSSSPLVLLDLSTEGYLLTEEAEVGVMAEEAQHDEVGVEAVQAVARVGVVARLRLHRADVLLDLVFALSGHLPVSYAFTPTAALTSCPLRMTWTPRHSASSEMRLRT